MSRWGPALLTALLAAAVWWPGASGVPFYNTPEPQEALVVREMVETGDWVLPRRNGEELPSKPPLFHWVGALIALLTGAVDERAARAPSILFAALTVALVFERAARDWGQGTAFLAATVLATSPEWARWAITARTDALFACLVAVSFLALERWERRPTSRGLSGFSAAVAAATLAKGPAGAFLPLLASIGGRRGRAAWRSIGFTAALLAAIVFVTIAGSWYAAALARGGIEFFQKQILAENLFRFLPSDGGPSRDHSIFFYVPALLGGMFPWSLALPAALAAARSAPDRRSSGLRVFLCRWMAVVFVVCSLASGKRSNYILPLYPAAALLIGDWLATRITERREGALRVAGWTAAALLGMLTGLLVAWRMGLAPWQPILPLLHPRDREIVPLVAGLLGPPPASWVATTLGLALALAVTLRAGSLRAATGVFVLLAWLATLAGSALVRPVEAELKTFAPFARQVAERVDPREPLRFFRQSSYGVLFYLHRHVPVEHRGFAEIPAPGWALVWEDDWMMLTDAERSSATIAETSPPASRSREHSRLLLLRIAQR